jgi:hypothetical protein
VEVHLVIWAMCFAFVFAAPTKLLKVMVSHIVRFFVSFNVRFFLMSLILDWTDCMTGSSPGLSWTDALIKLDS